MGIAISGVATSSKEVAAGAEPSTGLEARIVPASEGKVAALTPSLERYGAIDGHTFLAASAATLPVRSEFGVSWYERIETPKARAAAESAADDPFDRVVKEAALSREDMALAFKQASAASAIKLDRPKAADRTKVARIDPLNAKAARLASDMPSARRPSEMLAFADPSPKAESGAVAAVSAMAGNDGEFVVASIAPDAALPALEPEVTAPDYAVLPDSIPLPSARPKIARPKTEPAEVARPEIKQVARPEVDETTRTLFGRRKKDNSEETKVAFAKPDDVTKKEGFSFGRSHPKAGRGVAVYDISAARVYMPDGSVLEAHSGIGHMADNPNFVHVKMKGATPPHTYNLKMREKRFHGVEAIRMLPVDGKNKYGRDGFLTHSYLLRFRRGQSHGCVAFKDYDKFLAAFKAGKVRQLVVVPGGGKGIAAGKNKGREETRHGDA